MGTFGTPSSYNNTGALGSATNPTTAQGLSRDRENQKAILELPGTQAWVEKTITDGVIIPTSAEIVVLPEGGASTDSLTTIVLTSDGTTTLHEGMPIRLKAANSNTITVVHGTGTNNISTIDGNNVVLDTTWYLELKLINGLWVQQETSAYKTASEAKIMADTASAPASTTTRGNGRVATLADMEPDAVIENGPAFLAAGDVVSVIEEWRFIVGEFYYFRHPTLKPGFAPLQGGLISGVYQGKNITEYPIWDYLQTAEGQFLCKTEAEWQAMTTATWATLADGSTVGWDGIGGAPFYVQDLGAGTLRMPDVRGMYPEAAGFNSLGAGDAQGDVSRQITGGFKVAGTSGGIDGSAGVFYTQGSANYVETVAGVGGKALFDTSRVVPVGPANAPRRWGALACCYLGKPAS